MHLAGKELPVVPATLGTKLALGGCALGGAWSLVNVVRQIASAGGPGEVAVAAGLGLASAAIAYCITDLSSGFLHHGLGNNVKPGEGVVGDMAATATAHHYFAQSSEQTSWAGEWDPMAKGVAPLALGLGLWNPHYTVGAASLATLAGVLFSQTSHRLTHQGHPSPAVKCRATIKTPGDDN